jgi:EAL domain-containing protein (putative c-di-GMP-specific phosphodiesterase class I)/ActR/RegA family two-component response regulator
MVADDDEVVRDALADLIEASDGMTVAAVAADADEAIAMAQRVQPDVALVDVRMPGGGANATRGILKLCPRTRVLALSASGGRDTVLEMLQAGAAGYLVKGILPIELINGIREVAAGQAPISAQVAGGVIERVQMHLQAENQEQQHRQQLVDQLSIALDGDGMEMVYQPIFDLETRRVVGVESLARFSLQPKRRPHEWFEAAATVGLATRLEVSALSRALSRRSQLPPGVFMTVNLSPGALMSREVLRAIPRGFADRLVIELTEHAPVSDYQALALSFAPLRASGAALAIDDAGAGFASLRHILELAPQFIKLDISITHKIEHDRAALALAVALTSFAGAIDAMIIAEGIESDSHLAALRSLGIRLGQGYHLAMPGPIEQLVGLAHGDSAMVEAQAG